MIRQRSSGAIDLRPPYRLAPGTVVVLTGPDSAVRDTVYDQAWRASIGLGHGTRPLFLPRPVFATYAELPYLEASELAEARGCLLINGWSWDYPDLGTPDDVSPSLVVAVTGVDGSAPSPQLPQTGAAALQVSGDAGQVGEAMYGEMFRLGLMAPRLAGETR